ncbi:MAG: DUF4390 domain-containing protein [Thiolinea sp.]
MIKNNFWRCWRQLLVVTSLWAIMFSLGYAAAERITVRDFSIYQGEGAAKTNLVADIRFDYQLTDYLRESLLNGITLRNEIRFELNWHSDWWWNKTEGLDKITADLKYDALSRQYQLVNKKSGENWNFSNLAAALEHVGTVKKYALPAIPAEALEGDAAIYIEATLEPVVSKSLDIPSKLSSLFSGEDHQLVSQGVLWSLTP